VAYRGTTGRVPREVCRGGRVDRGSASCLTRGGLRVDRAVEAAVLEAIQPVGVTAALEARDQVVAAHDTTWQALTLALEKARHEAQRAWRHDARVDPEHRLGAGERAHRWQAARARVPEVAAHLATLQSQPNTRREEQRQGFRTLGQELSGVWQHPSAPEALKKRLLRTVRHERMIHTTPEPPEPILPLHWPGGGHPAGRVARHAAGKHGRATAHASIAVIRELSQGCRDLPLAATLKRWGDRTGTGKPWRAHRVACVRYPYRLPHVPQGTDWLTRSQAARQFGGSETGSKRRIGQGILPASQVVPSAPWIIQRTALDLATGQAEVQAVRTGRARRPRLSGQTPRPLMGADMGGDCGAPSPQMDTPCRERAEGRRGMIPVRLSRLQTRLCLW
jgi:hypothetical protein